MLDTATLFGRHEFAIRRWHSLTGLMPIGGSFSQGRGYGCRHGRRHRRSHGCDWRSGIRQVFGQDIAVLS